MKMQVMKPFGLYDFEPAADDIRRTVLQGLAGAPKTLPCKLFYDQQGSKLFDQICGLEAMPCT